MSSIGSPLVKIIGGGLAGTEAAHQCLNMGLSVELYEMRPQRTTPAHDTSRLAELVCSNSLKSLEINSAPGLLKHEMTQMNSLVIEAGMASHVPAGKALAVNREIFSSYIEEKLMGRDGFKLCREEITSIPSFDELKEKGEVWILATGPLTSESLSSEIMKLCHNVDHLFFYDAIAPILSRESIDESKGFWANRWQDGGGDYFNIPLSKEEYERLIRSIDEAEKTPLHQFESTPYFESCLPVEVMVERGPETLRFGPLRPVGLFHPETGEKAHAVIQLRMENKDATMLSMVGFQTKMKWPEQKRVFQQIPALADVEILRFGSVHRNTYVESPKVLSQNLSFKRNPRVLLAGQLTGVEGYTESAACGLLAGRFAASLCLGHEFAGPPKGTLMGGLLDYIVHGSLGKFQPMNANMGLLPGIQKRKGMKKPAIKDEKCRRAKDLFDLWFAAHARQAQEAVVSRIH